MTYEILYGEKLIASITLQGECEIYEARFMPCNLYLEETDELDRRVDNVTNFYYWCATRVLTLDRKYAKEILNSMGMGQAVTNRERARVALSYHCLSLTDIYWVREAGELYLLKDGDQEAALEAVRQIGLNQVGESRASGLERTPAGGKCFGGGWRSFAVRRKSNGFTFQKFPPIFRRYPYTIPSKHDIVVKDCYKM